MYEGVLVYDLFFSYVGKIVAFSKIIYHTIISDEKKKTKNLAGRKLFHTHF